MSYSLTYRFSVLVFTRSPPAASLDNFPAAVQLRLNLHLFNTLTLYAAYAAVTVATRPLHREVAQLDNRIIHVT